MPFVNSARRAALLVAPATVVSLVAALCLAFFSVRRAQNSQTPLLGDGSSNFERFFFLNYDFYHSSDGWFNDDHGDSNEDYDYHEDLSQFDDEVMAKEDTITSNYEGFVYAEDNDLEDDYEAVSQYHNHDDDLSSQEEFEAVYQYHEDYEAEESQNHNDAFGSDEDDERESRYHDNDYDCQADGYSSAAYDDEYKDKNLDQPYQGHDHDEPNGYSRYYEDDSIWNLDDFDCERGFEPQTYYEENSDEEDMSLDDRYDSTSDESQIYAGGDPYLQDGEYESGTLSGDNDIDIAEDLPRTEKVYSTKWRLDEEEYYVLVQALKSRVFAERSREQKPVIFGLEQYLQKDLLDIAADIQLYGGPDFYFFF